MTPDEHMRALARAHKETTKRLKREQRLTLTAERQQKLDSKRAEQMAAQVAARARTAVLRAEQSGKVGSDGLTQMMKAFEHPGLRNARGLKSGKPMALPERPKTVDGGQTFHFSITALSKSSAAVSAALAGTKKRGSAASHAGYIEREGAAETVQRDASIEREREVRVSLDPGRDGPDTNQGYIERDGAAEQGGGAQLASFGNIADTYDERVAFWQKLEAVEQDPKQHTITIDPTKSPEFWERVRTFKGAGNTVPHVIDAALQLTDKGDVKLDDQATVDIINFLRIMGLDAGRNVDKSEDPVRISPARGGRVQTRIIAELPHEMTPAQRLRTAQDYCRQFEELGLPYWAVIHAPDEHNDRRNFHIHIALSERPAKRMMDPETAETVWDFEVTQLTIDDRSRKRCVRPHIQNRLRDLNHRSWPDTQRKAWCQNLNEHLREAGIGKLYDHRTYQAMGIEIEPRLRLSPQVFAKERKGEITKQGLAFALRQWDQTLAQMTKAHAKVQQAELKLHHVLDIIVRRLKPLDHPHQDYAEKLVAAIKQEFATVVLADGRRRTDRYVASRFISRIRLKPPCRMTAVDREIEEQVKVFGEHEKIHGEVAMERRARCVRFLADLKDVMRAAHQRAAFATFDENVKAHIATTFREDQEEMARAEDAIAEAAERQAAAEKTAAAGWAKEDRIADSDKAATSESEVRTGSAGGTTTDAAAAGGAAPPSETIRNDPSTPTPLYTADQPNEAARRPESLREESDLIPNHGRRAAALGSEPVAPPRLPETKSTRPTIAPSLAVPLQAETRPAAAPAPTAAEGIEENGSISPAALPARPPLPTPSISAAVPRNATSGAPSSPPPDKLRRDDHTPVVPMPFAAPDSGPPSAEATRSASNRSATDSRLSKTASASPPADIPAQVRRILDKHATGDLPFPDLMPASSSPGPLASPSDPKPQPANTAATPTEPSLENKTIGDAARDTSAQMKPQTSPKPLAPTGAEDPFANTSTEVQPNQPTASSTRVRHGEALDLLSTGPSLDQVEGSYKAALSSSAAPTHIEARGESGPTVQGPSKRSSSTPGPKRADIQRSIISTASPAQPRTHGYVIIDPRPYPRNEQVALASYVLNRWQGKFALSKPPGAEERAEYIRDKVFRWSQFDKNGAADWLIAYGYEPPWRGRGKSESVGTERTFADPHSGTSDDATTGGNNDERDKNDQAPAWQFITRNPDARVLFAALRGRRGTPAEGVARARIREVGKDFGWRIDVMLAEFDRRTAGEGDGVEALNALPQLTWQQFADIRKRAKVIADRRVPGIS